MFPARTPERPDGHECRGKCGGRPHGLCGEADPDRDNPMQRVCHDCLAAKRYSKGKGNAVKPQVERRKASDTGGVGAGPWKNAKSVTDNTDVMEAMQLDAADVMTEALKGTHVNKVNAVDIEDSSMMIRRGTGAVPPGLRGTSSHFVSLESAAEACVNGNTSFYLQKARMFFIKAHASKPVQQADMRQSWPRGGHSG